MNKHCDIVIFSIEGDLNVAKVSCVRSSLEELISGGCKRLILNMKKVDYIDSSGIGLLIYVTRLMMDRGGMVSLVNVSDQVYRALSMACLLDFIPVSLCDKKPVPILDPSVRPIWKRTLVVDSGCMTTCRKQMQELFGRLPLEQPEIFDITLAGGEAISNAIDHSGDETAYVTCVGYQDRVVVEVSDNGTGYSIDDDCECEQHTIERGRGIKLMRMLCDSVQIQKKPSGKGTLVILVKLLRPQTENYSVNEV